MTPTANLASTEGDADHPAEPAAEAGPYVLNLCSSTTPMALAQTDLPELKRFTFFVSRRFEEGRERFRLHMGFFANQAEAEEWLGVVRDIYPGAWAGEAPGKKLRARAAEAAAAQARHAAGPQKTAAPPAAVVPTPPVPVAAKPQSARPAIPPKAAATNAVQPKKAPTNTAPPNIPTLVPTLQAAPPPAAKAAPVAAAPAGVARAAKAAPPANPKRPAASPAALAPAPRAPSPPAARAPMPARTAPPARPAQARAGTAPAAGQRPAVKPTPNRPAMPAAVAPAAPSRPTAAPGGTRPAAPPAPRASQQAAKKPIFANSNVKEVLAALDTREDDTGETRLMPSPLARTETADDSSLTDTQVLRFLETRREDHPAQEPAALQADTAAESGISLLKPDDTGTRRALKEAVSHNDPVSFAVQLQWSVQPVALDKVPPLAIFSAYTLYSVEGSREGRKWYGLRLGFFNDAISAKQVAYYVRSEFNSVAVVPVSPGERERATEDNQRFSGVGAALKRPNNTDSEFKLIDSEEAPRAMPAAAAAPSAAAASPTPGAPRPEAPLARSVRKASAKVGARERRTPQTLEETLEILGANELAIDNDRGESLNDTGVRHLRVEVQKNTPFSRLLERLSERVKKA